MKENEPQETSAKQESTLREYFVTTVVCTIFALFVTTFVVHPMTVPTPSMEPTILVGDRLLIDKFSFRNGYYPGLPLAPNNPDTLYVKRAIGLPGEELEIRGGTVYINGSALEEPYKVHRDSDLDDGRNYPRDPHRSNRRNNTTPIEIPDGNYFVMGDNRDDSADSRYFGFLPRSHIVGRPLVVFWSYEDASDAYLKNSIPEMLGLYLERIVFFVTRTRWSRMGHVVS
ncbi:MAG: signal peptidase I [Candidatus Aminicenantes bacterium]|nr:signal peptidase I [Candidatus Aminicenantes bacterium]